MREVEEVVNGTFVLLYSGSAFSVDRRLENSRRYGNSSSSPPVPATSPLPLPATEELAEELVPYLLEYEDVYEVGANDGRW